MADKKVESLQNRFFERIKDIIHPSVSLVNEISEVLEISSDSAYRRLRDETPLTIDEISTLCNHFKIGFDIFSGDAGSVSFSFNQMHDIDGYKKYLTDIHDTLANLAKSDNAELYYAAVDVPIFHHFNYPELSAFKTYYWLHDILNNPIFEGQKFSKSLINNDLIAYEKEIYKHYCQVPSIEIWTPATLNSSVAQIEFYFDSGLFENNEIAMVLCNQLEEEIKTIQKQAELGSKNIDQVNPDNFKLYFCEIEIGNNCILTKKADTKTVYLSFHTFNKLTTLNTKFCDDTFKWLNNIIRKSTLISGVSEKQRYIFFKKVFEKIAKLKAKLESAESKTE